jgi:hypothetical protein
MFGFGGDAHCFAGTAAARETATFDGDPSMAAETPVVIGGGSGDHLSNSRASY